MTASVERRAACGASYNACASGATPRKFETPQPARPAGKRGRTVNFNAELGRGRLGDWKELLRLLYRKLLEDRVTDLTTGSLGRRSFNRIVHQRELPALETDDRMY